MELKKKTGRYFLYAAGEIILVVVGILIALQINTWNEGRKLEQQRLELIENLKKDFQTNQTRLDTIIGTVGQNNEDLKAFLSVASRGNDHLSLLELKTMAGSGFKHEVFQPAPGTYDAAVSTGAIGLLKSLLFNEFMAVFHQQIADFERHDAIGGQMMYLGSYWEVRKQMGTLHSIDHNPDNIFEPNTYLLSDGDYRVFIAKPEVYAAFENMQWIYQNQYEILVEAKTTTEEVLAILDSL
jgi:hypothetical protein